MQPELGPILFCQFNYNANRKEGTGIDAILRLHRIYGVSVICAGETCGPAL